MVKYNGQIEQRDTCAIRQCGEGKHMCMRMNKNGDIWVCWYIKMRAEKGVRMQECAGGGKV